MRMKTVLVLMVLVGLGVLAYSLGLQNHLLKADENEARHACRHLCSLQAKAVAGDEGTLGSLAAALADRGCEALEDTPLLAGCRERALGLGLSVADYHCVLRAESLDAARACSDRVPR